MELACDMDYASDERTGIQARHLHMLRPFTGLVTLEPGDVCATGTPAGTGQERLELLKARDIIETEVEGLGRHRNKVVARTADYGAGHNAPR
jgi:Fumarylacetoacetate (FAA) hydrolase family